MVLVDSFIMWVVSERVGRQLQAVNNSKMEPKQYDVKLRITDSFVDWEWKAVHTLHGKPTPTSALIMVSITRRLPRHVSTSHDASRVTWRHDVSPPSRVTRDLHLEQVPQHMAVRSNVAIWLCQLNSVKNTFWKDVERTHTFWWR